MSGIVVFGGTVEGRLLTEAFSKTELEVHICVATSYGASLLAESAHIHVHAGRMDEEAMEGFLAGLSADYCLDATHPYAAEATANIFRACQACGLPYIRVLRREGEIESQGGTEDVPVVYKDSAEEAAAFLCTVTGNVLLTTGSKELEKYTVIPDYQNRCFARVLPTLPVMEKCRELGFEGKNVIGMQGPFSEELNYHMLRQIKASWLVTKNSGREGGYQEKCEAALRAGVGIVVIGRQKELTELAQEETKQTVQVMQLQEAISFLKKHYGLEDKRRVFLIGMGPGSCKLLTREAQDCLESCDVIIGAGRLLEVCRAYGDKPVFACYQKEEIAKLLQEHPEYKRAALVYSGDIGFYSGARGMAVLLPEYEVYPVPGISSAVYFLDRLSVPWHEVDLVSCHGQKVPLLTKIRRQKKVCALLGQKDAIREISRQLLAFGLEEVQITVGERLSYPEEQIFRGTPAELLDREIDTLSIVLFENPHPEEKKTTFQIADDAFLRGKVPMTKQEIRTLSLAKLGLTQGAVLYDIGAGTGSVAVEAALQCVEGAVYAIEKKPEGISLILENQKKFGVENLIVTEGEAPEALAGLLAPTHAFIGGSGGRLLDIIGAVREKNREVRFVLNAVTLETLAQTERIKEVFPEYRDMEIVQVSVSKSRALGDYHLMQAENPVYIISFGGRKEEADGE